MTRAVVLAAGTGSRLGNGSAPAPKPLRVVQGVPLVVRVLRALQESGIREAVVVVGHRGDEVRTAIESDPTLLLDLHFVDNERYLNKNGVSLLAAREFVDRECVLTMADHLYSPELVRRLLSAELAADTCALAVDYDVERCFDLDDATKVKVDGTRIADIGKEIAHYDAIDTGVFRIGPRLIEELARLDELQGDCSLSEGVCALAERGAFVTVDVGDVRWIDVDTPAALERAEAMLRVFGDSLGDEPGTGPRSFDPEALELFAPSWVRAAKPYNEAHFATAERGDLVRMMSNESPYAPSERVVQAILQAALRGNLYPSAGPNLRERLGEREGLSQEHVILGAGSTELIDVIIRTFVAPGEEVLLSVPTFSMYEARTRAAGGIPVLVPMREDQDHDIIGMLRGVTERTKVVFLCSPNNPTGNRIPEAEMRRLLGLGLPTVIDEAYIELGSGDTLTHLLRDYPNAIILRTFSKAYGLAGLRLGYALAHPVAIRLLERVKVPWNVPEITLVAALAALEDVTEHAQRVANLRGAREQLIADLARLPAVKALPSDGNFVLIDASATGLSADELVRRVQGEGVLIRSLGAHHAEKSFVRVTVGNAQDNARFVAALSRVVHAHARPGRAIYATDAE
ncbi:MAG: histidinol-phosphate transaminase [Polyangiaceae bacterium]